MLAASPDPVKFLYSYQQTAYLFASLHASPNCDTHGSHFGDFVYFVLAANTLLICALCCIICSCRFFPVSDFHKMSIDKASHSVYHLSRMMNHSLRALLALSLLSLALSAPMPAQDEETTNATTEQTTKNSDKKPGKKGKGEVFKALYEMDVFNAEPNPKARFFIYLQSASWCPPCRKEMPKIVEEYPAMKEKGVEVILVGCDQTRDGALKYLETFKAPFPGVHFKDEGLKQLPGFAPSNSVPSATLVDAKGNVIASGHAQSVFAKWKENIDPKKIKQKRKDQAAAEREAKKKKK